MGSMKFEIEKFNEKCDFGMWRKKMKAILVQQKCAKALGGEKDLPATLSADEKQELKELAYSTIILNLTDNVLRQVNDEDTAAKVWNKLESLYMTKSLSGKIYLKEQLFGFKMDQSKSLEDNLDDFIKLNIELANVDSTEALSDENQAIIVLNSLPDSYKDLKAAIKCGRDSLSLEDVLGALRSRETEMRSEKKASSGEGLNVKGRTEKKNNSRKGRGKSRSKSRAKGKRCFHCDKEGHFRRDCPERKNKKTQKTQEDGDAAVVSDDGYESADVLTVSTKESHGEWILDSDCTYHMCPMRDLFAAYQSIDVGKVLMGNNVACMLIGIGSVKIKMFDSEIRTLTNVRHIPDLKRNLISLSTLDEAGYSFKGNEGTLKISKGIMAVMKGQRCNGLYSLIGSTITGTSAVGTPLEQDKTKLWHMRLGHVSERGLRELYRQGLLCGDSIGKLDYREHCIIGKQTRLKFSTGVHTSKGTLDYVHSDV
ncbi:hypothetical protein LWI28_018815 [Acer negundo]|uniref:CCHC-type domain-containing protein n=1 Tax=Acer negundo TaxID=4023 RepID=A0AAD5J6S2_ACENE|nr:hypothetical protein LWI28_018815 [Acer negundo]